MNASVDTLVERSSIYREFLAEREEVLWHKWLESEKVGADIGFEAALVNRVVHHRARWRKERLSQSKRAFVWSRSPLSVVGGPSVLLWLVGVVAGGMAVQSWGALRCGPPV